MKSIENRCSKIRKQSKNSINSGSYQLIIHIKKDRKIQIGALGEFNFLKGYYVYTGSAMTNLKQRVERHKRKIKKIKWHIDFLLADKYVKIIDIKLFPSIKKEECIHNLRILKNLGAYVPVKGFGSSDCRRCPAHLIGLSEDVNPIDNKKLI